MRLKIRPFRERKVGVGSIGAGRPMRAIRSVYIRRGRMYKFEGVNRGVNFAHEIEELALTRLVIQPLSPQPNHPRSPNPAGM